MDKCLLNVQEKPSLVFKPIYTALLNSGSTNQSQQNWIFNNFIQIRNKSGRNVMDFVLQDINPLDSCPFVKHLEIPRLLLNIDIIPFLEKCLCDQYYSFFMIDTFFVSNYINYKEKHGLHDIFIYGFDRTKQVFYTGDFFNYEAFTYQTVKYSELQEAYLKISQDLFEKRKVLNIDLFIPNETEVIYSPDAVKSLIDDYIESKNTFHRMDITKQTGNDKIYGLSVVQDLIKNLMEYEHIDKRSFSLLYIHKKIMLERLQYMNFHALVDSKKFNDVYSIFEILKQDYEILLMLSIKYIISNNLKTRHCMKQQLLTLYDKERKAFNLLRYLMS